MRATAKISKEGRILIPAELRKEADLRAGDEVVITFADGALRLSTNRTAIASMRARLAELHSQQGEEKAYGVDEFLKWRRQEAKREL